MLLPLPRGPDRLAERNDAGADRYQHERCGGGGGEVGAGLGDLAVEHERQDVDLGADKGQRGAVGADGDRRGQAECGDEARQDLRQHHLDHGTERAGAERARRRKLAAVQVADRRQHDQHHARHEVIGVGEPEANGREDEGAGHRGIEAELGEQQRDKAGAAQQQDEAVGDDQARKCQRQLRSRCGVRRARQRDAAPCRLRHRWPRAGGATMQLHVAAAG